jgi:hypothetical protein
MLLFMLLVMLLIPPAQLSNCIHAHAHARSWLTLSLRTRAHSCISDGLSRRGVMTEADVDAENSRRQALIGLSYTPPLRPRSSLASAGLARG